MLKAAVGFGVEQFLGKATAVSILMAVIMLRTARFINFS